MSERGKLLKPAACVVLAVLLLCLFWVFPLSGDDWFREELGASLHSPGDLIRTVAGKWLTTNGRILGNVLAYTAGSRPIARLLLRTVITFALVLLMIRNTGLKSFGGSALIASAVIMLPLEMFVQIYPWAAGYFNYVPPVAILLGIFAITAPVFEKHPIPDSACVCVGLFLLGFAAQLFVENDTLYTVLAAAGLLLLNHHAKAGKSKPLWCLLIGSLLGAVLLFLSPSYRSVAQAGNAYRMTLGLRGLFTTALHNGSEVFAAFGSGAPVPAVGITLLLFLYLRKSEKRSALAFTAFAVSAACVLAFVLIRLTGRFGALSPVCSALWLAAAILCIWKCLPAGSTRTKACWFLLSAAAAALPLLVVSPIGPRCMYLSYVFLVLAAGTLLAALPAPKNTAADAAGILLFLAVTAFCFFRYLPLHQVTERQRALAEAALTRGETAVALPRCPKPELLWEADCGEKMKYAWYREEPGDFAISFTDEENT